MSFRAVAAAIVVSLFMPLAASAQTGGSTPPDFAPMTYFVGIWHCTYTKHPDPKMIGQKYSIEGATTKDGYWELLDVRDGEIHIARDAAANRWTFIYLGNGGDYSIMSTPGWVGKTLTLKEVLTYGGAPQGTATFERESDMQFIARYSARTASGVDSFASRCDRV